MNIKVKSEHQSFVFIVIHYGDSIITNRLIESLLDQIHCIDAIIIVDNSNNYISSSIPKIHILRSVTNLGYGGAVNNGIKYAINMGYYHFFISNNDVVVSPDFMSRFLRTQFYQDCAIISTRINYLLKKNKIWYNGGVINRYTLSPKHFNTLSENKKNVEGFVNRTYFFTGCFFYLNKKVIEKLGYFDEKFFLYEEDTDYSIRAIKNGVPIYLLEDIIVFHQVSANVSKINLFQNFTDEIYHLRIRNRMIIIKRYANPMIRIISLCALVPRIIKYSLMFAFQLKIMGLINLYKFIIFNDKEVK